MKRKQDPTPSPGGEDPRRVAPEDIQAKEFRMARLGGYKERDVDEFLDELTEAWTAPGAEPETAERLPETAEEGEQAASGSEEEPDEKPIRIEEPEPAIVRATEDDPKTSRETSLRELFWGEE